MAQQVRLAAHDDVSPELRLAALDSREPFDDYQPTEQDHAEYNAYLDGQLDWWKEILTVANNAFLEAAFEDRRIHRGCQN